MDEAALHEARIAESDAIAFLDQNDVENLDAAPLARELAPNIRIVVWMFDDVLAASVHELVSDCAVLSSTAVAAPAFVAAVGGQTPTPLRVFGRSLFVTERTNTQPEDVVCGLAITEGLAEPLVLPDRPGDADLVLTREVTNAETEHAPATVADVHRRARRRALQAMLSLIGARLRPVIAAVLLIVLAGTVTLTLVEHVNWWQGFYLAVLSTLGGAQAVGAPAGRRLTRTDTLLAITNRDGLGDLLHRAASSDETRAIMSYDAPPPMPRAACGGLDVTTLAELPRPRARSARSCRRERRRCRARHSTSSQSPRG